MPTGISSSRVIWDDSTEKHLLILILLQSKPQVDWTLVAEKFGHGVTPGALMQKYQKIRKRDSVTYGMEDGGSAAATPKSSSKRSRVMRDDTDDDEFDESPSKKVKSGKSGKGGKGKIIKEEYAESEATTVKKDFDSEGEVVFDGVNGEDLEA